MYRKDFKSGGNSGKKYAGKSFGKKKFGGDSARPTLHSAICSECDQECQVPFKPSGDKPVFCRDCFKNKGDAGSRISMHKTTCATCGDECEVPFRPSGEKPIYCNKCFGKGFDKKGGAITTGQFEILNRKLDRILEVLDGETR